MHASLTGQLQDIFVLILQKRQAMREYVNHASAINRIFPIFQVQVLLASYMSVFSNEESFPFLIFRGNTPRIEMCIGNVFWIIKHECLRWATLTWHNKFLSGSLKLCAQIGMFKMKQRRSNLQKFEIHVATKRKLFPHSRKWPWSFIFHSKWTTKQPMNHTHFGCTFSSSKKIALQC